jgi:hypothetical protein
MKCEPFLKNCINTMAFRVFKMIELPYNLSNTMSKIGMEVDGQEEARGQTTQLFTIRSNFEIFAPPRGSANDVALRSINKTFNSNCTLYVEAVSWETVSPVVNTIEVNRSISFDEDYPFEHTTVRNFFTVRSSVLNISTRGRMDDNEYFARPISIRFNYNPIKVGTTNVSELQVDIANQNHLCLGVITGSSEQNWICASRKIIGVSSTVGAQIEYEVPGPGIYAVIFRPDFVESAN